MELRHLRYLIAVADAGTFIRAAEALRVAQPALSRQINDLERQLGIELFESGARKATLTDAGQAAVRIARHVIADTERAVARARMSKEGLLGNCTVICGPVPLMTGLMGQLVARLRSRHPAITVTVQEGAFPYQWENVANGEADLALGAAPPASFQALAVETQIVHTVDVAVLPPDSPLAGRASISLADLSGQTYLGLEHSTPDVDEIRDMLLREIKRQRIELGEPRLFPSLESLLSHVRAGQGWTIMPRLFAGTLAPLVGVPIEDFRAPFRTVRIWRRADSRPMIRTILTELRALQHEGVGDGAAREPAPSAPAREFVPVRLDLRHLRSFVHVAEQGSLGRAADTLAITQPALSRQMRELEYDVGAQLLERVTRGVVLTPAGQALYSDALSVLSIVDRLPAEVRRIQRGSAERRCVIGVVPHYGIEEIATNVIAEMEDRRPRVRVGTRTVMTPTIPDLLRRSELDVGIGFAYPARVPSVDFVTTIRLFDDEMSYALLAPSHPLATAKSLSLRELEGVPFLFASRTMFPPLYDVIMHQFDVAGAKPRIEATYDGLMTIRSMAAQGLGWAVATRVEADHPPTGTVAVPLRDFRLPWGAELLYRKDESREAILAVIDATVDCARQMFGTPISTAQATLPSGNAPRAVMS